MSYFNQAFIGVERVYTEGGLQRLKNAHVTVVGLGGVGSWAVDALARTGVGAFHLIDFDDVCVSNTTRQSHTFKGTLGRMKTEVMKERVLAINPEANVDVSELPITPENTQAVLSDQTHVVIDAIDSFKAKVAIAQWCYQQKIPLVMSGTAGGRRNPGQVAISTLWSATNDPMLAKVRKELRHASQTALFEQHQPDLVAAVFSRERAVVREVDSSLPQRGGNCQTTYGSLSFVTGTFGFMAAAYAVEQIQSQNK